MSYPGHWLGESYFSAEMQSVYSTFKYGIFYVTENGIILLDSKAYIVFVKLSTI